MDHYQILDSVSAFRRMLRDADKLSLYQAAHELEKHLETESTSRPLGMDPLFNLSEAITAELKHRKYLRQL